MILTGSAIKEAIKTGEIEIDPYNENQVGPNSYDLYLDNILCYYTNHSLDSKKNEPVEIKLIEPEGLKLFPDRLYLGKTREHISSHSHIPILTGRSSIGRLSISVHITAGFGDIGFCGNWTLEISVVQPVVIYPNTKIAQIYWMPPYGSVEEVYDHSRKYQNSREIVPSKLWQEFK